MKTILVFFSIFTVSICSAHITNDYPFKTFLDSYNNLYIAGYEKNKTHPQIKIQKIINPNNSGDPWTTIIPNQFGAIALIVLLVFWWACVGRFRIC